MTGAFDSDGQLALLLGAQAGLANWLDLTVQVNESLQCFNVFVVKKRWGIFFKSFNGHSGSFQGQKVEGGY